MKELIINVEGMVCGGCEKRVQNALKTIKGVKDVVADHTNGIVKLKIKENVEKEIIKQKVEDLGFVVKED